MTTKACCFCGKRSHSRAECPAKKPCFKCDGELVLKRVRRETRNKGRLFYCCSSPQCSVFLWADNRGEDTSCSGAGHQDNDSEDDPVKKMSDLFAEALEVADRKGARSVVVKMQHISVIITK